MDIERPISEISLIWCDNNAATFQNVVENGAILKKFDGLVDFHFCQDSEKCHELIQRSTKAVLVVSGQKGSEIVKQIDGGLQKVKNVVGVIIYCQNIKTHLNWSSDYMVVTKVCNDIRECMEEAKALIKIA